MHLLVRGLGKLSRDCFAISWRVMGPVESKTRTYHRRARSGRTAGWQGGVKQDWMPTELFAKQTSFPRTFQTIENTSLECFPRNTNKQNPMQTDGGTKPAIDNWFITGLSAVNPRFIPGLSPGWEALFLPGSWPVFRRLFVSVNPFHARHFRENVVLLSSGQSSLSAP